MLRNLPFRKRFLEKKDLLRKNKEKGRFPRTQKELAEVMKVSPQQINKYIRGTENLTLETLLRISQVLNNPPI